MSKIESKKYIEWKREIVREKEGEKERNAEWTIEKEREALSQRKIVEGKQCSTFLEKSVQDENAGVT